MSGPVKVGLFGATGESGGLILNGLLESENLQFKVTALARESSAGKQEYAQLAQRDVAVVAIKLDGPEEEVAAALEGLDIVIASVPPHALDSQLPLARAAKRAGIKRFVPSAYAMAVSPGGISVIQDKKELIYDEIKKLDLAYTIIDVGWWHYGFIPRLPSGRTEYAIALPELIINMIPGDGNMKTCVVDTTDVGRFVARIIVDSRTLNKKVMAHGEILTFNEIYETVETLTGEMPERKFVPAMKLESMTRELRAKAEVDQSDFITQLSLFWLEYYYSSFILGDNSPQGIERLGYLKAVDLFPDIKTVKFEQFFRDILHGHKRVPYSRE